MQTGETHTVVVKRLFKNSTSYYSALSVLFIRRKSEKISCESQDVEKQFLSSSCQKFFYCDVDYQQQVIYPDFFSCPVTDLKGT